VQQCNNGILLFSGFSLSTQPSRQLSVHQYVYWALEL